MRRDYGRCKKGERLYGVASSRKDKRTNIIGAWNNQRKLFAATTCESNVNGEIFLKWVKEWLAPTLLKGDVVVMDNAPWHKSDEIRKIIESVGAKLIYLPPYSPDFNKIEQQWANLKEFIRKIIHHETMKSFKQKILYTLGMNMF